MSNNKIIVIGILFLITLIAVLFWPRSENYIEVPDGKISVVMYKDPNCGCCTEWAKYMNSQEFYVVQEATNAMMAVKQSVGVPARFESCHTARVGKYFIEGHVPADDIRRLLKEQPDALGLTVPGMPIGSPGMEGPNPQKYDVFLVHRDGSTSVFASHSPR